LTIWNQFLHGCLLAVGDSIPVAARIRITSYRIEWVQFLTPPHMDENESRWSLVSDSGVLCSILVRRRRGRSHARSHAPLATIIL
jgi:hypothetical protein